MCYPRPEVCLWHPRPFSNGKSVVTSANRGWLASSQSTVYGLTHNHVLCKTPQCDRLGTPHQAPPNESPVAVLDQTRVSTKIFRLLSWVHKALGRAWLVILDAAEHELKLNLWFVAVQRLLAACQVDFSPTSMSSSLQAGISSPL